MSDKGKTMKNVATILLLTAVCLANGLVRWHVVPNSQVKRHITEPVGPLGNQHCTNGGDGSLEGGFLRCTDTFTNKRTGAKCKVNPQGQRSFVCQY